jgi:hypothetical protein
MDLYLGEGTCFQRAKRGSVPANQNTFGGLTARLGVFPEAANPPGGAAPVSVRWQGLALRSSWSVEWSPK